MKTKKNITKMQALRMLASSKQTVTDFSGFSFEPFKGDKNLFTFLSLKGVGVCWVKKGDRYKYSRAIML